MATYFGTSINESPTIIMEAGAKLEDVQGIALAITAGKLAKPSAGANVVKTFDRSVVDTILNAGIVFCGISSLEVTGEGYWQVGRWRGHRSRR